MLPDTFLEDMRKAITTDLLAPLGLQPSPSIHIKWEDTTAGYDARTSYSHSDFRNPTAPPCGIFLVNRIKAEQPASRIAATLAHELIHASLSRDDGWSIADAILYNISPGHTKVWHKYADAIGLCFEENPNYSKDGPKFREWFNKKSTELYGHVI